jgi:hypothetical protein
VYLANEIAAVAIIDGKYGKYFSASSIDNSAKYIAKHVV